MSRMMGEKTAVDVSTNYCYINLTACLESRVMPRNG